MISSVRTKSSGANVLKSEMQSQRTSTGIFQTVVFSRKSTNHGPDDTQKGSPERKQLANLNPNPLASIVHQTDRNGKQNAISTPQIRGPLLRRSSKDESESGFTKIFANIWSALGISEQQIQSQKASRVPTPDIKPSNTSPRKVIELRKSVIGSQLPQDAGKKCLVLDLDETLVHSSFKPTQNPDYIIPVEIEGTVHQVYVCKRPGVDEFLRDMSKNYEIVVYTASLSKYADPLLDRLDPDRVIRYRLFREHCVQYEGNYVKDLSLLDREISQTIIIDNSPMSYLFHPRNAIGCSSFIDDMCDRELHSIGRFLTAIRDSEDVRSQLHTWTASY
jgi:RNA polymerase II subunit A small phosphatase-like protein